MAYFNHAFQQTHLGTGNTGFIAAAPQPSVNWLSLYGPGAFAFANQDAAGFPNVPVAPSTGIPLTLVSTSHMSSDKIGPFHGGYQETTKSKKINPKFISKFWKVTSKPAASNIIGVGLTPGMDDACCPTFYCDQTYNLRLDIKGSAALRTLTRNAYEMLSAYTGCCTDATPTAVDPALVMLEWAKYIHDDPIMSGVYNQRQNRLVNVGVVVKCVDDSGEDPVDVWTLYLPANEQTGVPGLYFGADGETLTTIGQAYVDSLEAAFVVTTDDEDFAFENVLNSGAYVSTFGTVDVDDCCAGLVIEAAFQETKFGDCTFQVSDHYEIEPLVIQASMVDETGDPCIFEQLCISDGITPSGTAYNVYPAIQVGRQPSGTGESVLRDFLLSESYRGNDFNSSNDLRIREITLGYDLTSAVNRNSLYTSYYILHTVPRYNNTNGAMNGDQYLLRIVTNGTIAAFETFVDTWLANAGNHVTMETI